MGNLYSESWRLYKAHSESFVDDYNYYYQFCKNHKTLELFAGYGRLTNFLAAQHIDIESVEIEIEFAKHIKLVTTKNHIQNVLQFSSTSQFDRIIAGYNSFCLFTKEEDIKNFFTKVDSLLVPGGYASLNYFKTEYWKDAPTNEIMIDGVTIKVVPHYDLSRANEGYGLWIDEYEFQHPQESVKIKYEYPVRVYANAESLFPFYQHTNLELIDMVENFGLDKETISEPGWIDYVFKKKL